MALAFNAPKTPTGALVPAPAATLPPPPPPQSPITGRCSCAQTPNTARPSASCCASSAAGAGARASRRVPRYQPSFRIAVASAVELSHLNSPSARRGRPSGPSSAAQKASAHSLSCSDRCVAWYSPELGDTAAERVGCTAPGAAAAPQQRQGAVTVQQQHALHLGHLQAPPLEVILLPVVELHCQITPARTQSGNLTVLRTGTSTPASPPPPPHPCVCPFYVPPFSEEYLPALSWHKQRGQLVFTTL
jgi:hypothetical protein